MSKYIQFTLLGLFIFQAIQAEIPLIIWALQDKQSLLENCINKNKPKSCCAGRCQRDKSIASALETESGDRVKIEKPTLKILITEPFDQVIPNSTLPVISSTTENDDFVISLDRPYSPPTPPPRKMI